MVFTNSLGLNQLSKPLNMEPSTARQVRSPCPWRPSNNITGRFKHFVCKSGPQALEGQEASCHLLSMGAILRVVAALIHTVTDRSRFIIL